MSTTPVIDMPHTQRSKQLIHPRLQLRLVLTFLGVSLVGLLLQFVLFAATISALAAELPQDGPLLVERIPSYTLTVFAISVCVLFPLTMTIGILTTFRVAGPLFRFEQHLKAIARGEDPGECRIRKGDQLQEFCASFNEALVAMRRQGWSPRERPSEVGDKALKRVA
jgi:hypothetical protein